MSEKRQWRAISGFTLNWQSWGNEHIIYNEGSGDTHLFNDLAALILNKLQEGAATVDDLLQFLAASHNQDKEEDLQAQINELLLELDRVGVIERIR